MECFTLWGNKEDRVFYYVEKKGKMECFTMWGNNEEWSALFCGEIRRVGMFYYVEK